MGKRKAAKVQQAGKRRRRTAPEGPDDRNLNMKMEPETTKGPNKAENSLWRPLTFADGVHPLHIEHILENVLHFAIMPTATQREQGTHADHKTVHSIRLVSHQWNYIGTKVYRKAREPFTFTSEDDDIKMKRFLAIMKNSGVIPVEKYAFGENFLVPKNHQLLKDFMRIFGPSATELQFTYGFSSNLNSTMFSNLELVKLQSLHIHLDKSSLRFSLSGNIRNVIENLQGMRDNFQEFQKLVELLRGAAHNLRQFHYEKESFDGVFGLILRAIRFSEAIPVSNLGKLTCSVKVEK